MEIYWYGKCANCSYSVIDYKAFSQPNWDCLYYGNSMLGVSLNGGCSGPKSYSISIANKGKEKIIEESKRIWELKLRKKKDLSTA